MSVKKFVTLLILLLSANAVVGQVRMNDFSDLNLRITDNITSSLFKDSTALYTFNIQIKVGRESNYLPVISSTNEQLSKNIIPAGLLQGFNYKKLMNEKENVILIVPVSITVLDSKQDEKFINLSSLDNKLASLFYIGNKAASLDIFYLAPVIVTIDKRVYN
jgi:hypothetical protein